MPSLIIVVMLAKFFKKYVNTCGWNDVMSAIRPVSVALILFAGLELFRMSVNDCKQLVFAIILGVMIYFYKKEPVFYILLSGVLGWLCDL